MSTRKQIRWILEELPRLREEGVIQPETEQRLSDYYASRFPENRNYFTLSLAILGVVLIAGGIILLFNYNWDMLTKYQQIAVSFLPLFLGVVVSMITLSGGRNQLWREASAIFTAAGGAVALGLLSQIYQLNGTLSGFMLLVLLTSLPLLWIFNSIGLATLYCIGLFMTLDIWDSSQILWSSYLLSGGIVFYLLFHLLRRGSPYRIYARYLMMAVIFFILLRYCSYCPPVMLLTVAGLFQLLSRDIADGEESFWRNPWLISSFILLCVMLGIGAESDQIFKIRSWGSNSESLIVGFWIMESILLCAGGVVLIRDYCQKKLGFIRILLFIPVLLGLGGYLLYAFELQWCSRLLINGYMLLLGCVLLRDGVITRSQLTFNAGLILCAELAMIRFFSMDFGLLYRGLGMIFAGIVVIVLNIIFSHRIRGGEEVCDETK